MVCTSAVSVFMVAPYWVVRPVAFSEVQDTFMCGRSILEACGIVGDVQLVQWAIGLYQYMQYMVSRGVVSKVLRRSVLAR